MTTQRSEAHGDVWIVEWQRIGGDMEQEEFHTLTAANKFYDELMDSEDDFEFINEPWLAEGADEKFIKGKTMKSESIEDLRDRSVSSGTLKSEDLIPKFLGVLKTYGKDKYDAYIKENPEVEDWENLDEETMGWVVDELTDLLNEIAPDGCYFGASEGDGADFGFWSMSNESKKSEVAEGSDYFVIVFTSNEDAVKGAEYARNLGENPQLPPGGKAVYVYGNDRDALKAFGKKWFDLCVDDDLGTTSTFGLNVKDESKKSEADGNKDIFTLDLTRIDADGDEEGLDDMQAAQTFYDEDDAIKAAKELADSYKDDDGVVQVIVMAGEQEKPNGDIVGDSFDIYWASSSDKQTTADYRKKARYAAFDNKMDYYAKGGKSEGNDDDKGCKGKDCKDDKTKKNEADATFKVGDFVSYEAGKDGKDPYDAYVYCEVIGINDDGTLDLCPFGTDANTDGIGDNANPAYCEKLDHFAGMVDAHHYYMDGKYNAYKGGWEILITDKELNPKVYEFIGTIDDLSEVIDIDDYYGGENFVFDEDLKDEVATNTGWDVETTTFADMTGDVGESKQTEGLPPKKLGNRLYRSRADLINKMKTLDAVEITTPAQFNDIHSKQWLHTAGYAMDINGNLVGQTYFGDKDGKWYYATTKTFQGDYLPECKEEANKSESLTLKQKELKDLVRLGEAEDITAISDAEAKELKKKGVETIGVSRGTYGMNGALLRDYDGKKYAILARNGNLFYFV